MIWQMPMLGNGRTLALGRVVICLTHSLVPNTFTYLNFAGRHDLSNAVARQRNNTSVRAYSRLFKTPQPSSNVGRHEK